MPQSATIQVAPFLMFRCGAISAVLPLQEARETLRPLPIIAMESAPPFVKGLAVIRGLVTVVVDGARLLDSDNVPATSPAASARFISLRVPERPVALAVDSVLGVRHLTAEALAALPPLVDESNDGPIERLARLDGDIWMLLSTARLVSKIADLDMTPSAAPA